MSASDNVLRGGLTPKHVDVAELLGVLDFHTGPPPLMRPDDPAAGVRVFRPDVPDFELVVVQPQGEPVRFAPAGESILLCTLGEVAVAGATSEYSLSRGDSAYVTVDETPLVFSGTGTVFLATINSR
jgi:mannose-6-phosphate isomerase